MTRIVAIAVSVFVLGVALAPAVQAEDTMMEKPMHKAKPMHHAKKPMAHKDSMMKKDDAMMKGDAMAK
jgi:pentapeptide MXKDX repeat protein